MVRDFLMSFKHFIHLLILLPEIEITELSWLVLFSNAKEPTVSFRFFFFFLLLNRKIKCSLLLE